jgi:acetylglutamate kinase
MTTQRIMVIKIGGRALESPGAVKELAGEAGRFTGRLVLVHGGGAAVTDWCRRLGIAPQFADGLRVTDAATLEVAVAVLAGLSNKSLVAALRDGGMDAVGLSAVDGGLIETVPHPDVRLGAVGRIVTAHPALLLDLLAARRTPVVASIGGSGGALLNLNADDVASAIAGAIGASELVFLSDTDALYIDGKAVDYVPSHGVGRLLDHPDVRDGMRPKLRAAHLALSSGVTSVRLGAWNGPGTLGRLFSGHGTTVSHV